MRRLNEELRKERDRVQEYLDMAGTMLLVCDPDQRIVLINKKGCEILGASEEEIVGKNWFDNFLPERLRDEVKAVFDQLIAGKVKPVEHYENPVLTANGQERMVAWHNSVLTDEEGRITGVLSSGEDVTERRQAREEIQRQNEFLNSVLASLTHPFYVVNADNYTVEMANPTASRDGLWENTFCYALTHGRDKPCESEECPCPLEQIKKIKKPVVVEHVHSDKDGNQRCVEVHGYPIFDGEGNVTRVIEYNLDVTDRKQAEEALRESQQRLAIRNRIANIFLTIPDEEMYGEVLDVILDVMKSEYGVFGYMDENEVFVVPSMTRHVWDECQVPDKTLLFPRETWGNSAWSRSIREKRVIYSNEPSTNIPEGHIPISRHISLPILYQEESIGLLQVANKETDYDEKDIQLLESIASHIAPILNARLQRDRQEKARKKAEQARELLNRKLIDANRGLEQIVYVASHDLRSPLVNIQGFSKELSYLLKEVDSVLSREDMPPAIKEELLPVMEEDVPEALQYILTSVSKMDSLLSGLLRLSRLGSAGLVMRDLDMTKLMAEIAKAFEFQIRESGANLQINELPWCRGDEVQINQLFSNLLDNALKYLDPDRAGIIRVSGYEEAGQAVYCIEDNGVGIAAEHQSVVFEIFHRLDPSAGSGEGLGLTIARRILDRHNGKIWIKSRSGKGSKFFVSLPGVQIRGKAK